VDRLASQLNPGGFVCGAGIAYIAVNDSMDAIMATLTIRNLDEEEARAILSETVGKARRGRPPLEEIMKLAVKPAQPVDQKRAQDELWDYLYDRPRQEPEPAAAFQG